MPKQRRLGGLLVRREGWALTGRGKLLLLFVLAAAFYGAVRGVHPFLTINNGGTGDVLVVEGWIFNRNIGQAAKAFQKGHYQCAVVVLDVYRDGNNWESGSYKAYYLAADLVQHGVPTNSVHTLFCPVVQKDRTYHCALATRQFLEQQHIVVHSIDVVTMATHTRRSRLLFEKAFKYKVRVGGIALDESSYDPAHWWRSSAGVRDVLDETIAYLYARFLFRAD